MSSRALCVQLGNFEHNFHHFILLKCDFFFQNTRSNTEENATEENPDFASEEDPGLAPLDDGKVACLKCSKILSTMKSARRHYKIKHVIDPKNKNIKCKICAKRFAVVIDYMKHDHVKQAHGISWKLLEKSVKPVFKKEELEQPSEEEWQVDHCWCHPIFHIPMLKNALITYPF